MRTTTKLKDQLNSIRPSIVQLVFTMLVIIVFQPNAEWLLAVLLYIHIVVFAINTLRERDRKKWVKPSAFLFGTIGTMVFLFVLFFLYKLFGPWGIWGVLIVIVLLVAYRIARTWKEFMHVKHEGERALWGMTLRERHEQKKKQEATRIRGENRE